MSYPYSSPPEDRDIMPPAPDPAPSDPPRTDPARLVTAHSPPPKRTHPLTTVGIVVTWPFVIICLTFCDIPGWLFVVLASVACCTYIPGIYVRPVLAVWSLVKVLNYNTASSPYGPFLKGAYFVLLALYLIFRVIVPFIRDSE